MVDENDARDRTALLFVDPYNDFLSEGGKLWPRVKGVAHEVGLLANLRTITGAIRKADIQIFIVPHRRWEPVDYEGWDHPNPYQVASGRAQAFAKGTWRGEWHPDFVPQPNDIIVNKHGGSSGFANTDLDFRLKQQGIIKVILAILQARSPSLVTSLPLVAVSVVVLNAAVGRWRR
jgi:nicotinamidase-related amidase